MLQFFFDNQILDLILDKKELPFISQRYDLESEKDRSQRLADNVYYQRVGDLALERTAEGKSTGPVCEE